MACIHYRHFLFIEVWNVTVEERDFDFENVTEYPLTSF